MTENKQSPDGAGGGNFYFLVRWWAGCHTQSDFARKTGLPASEINRIERGNQRPQAATERQILAGAGVPERLAGFLRWCYRLMRQARAMGQPVNEPATHEQISGKLQEAALEAIERSLAAARAASDLESGREGADRPTATSERNLQQAEALFETLSRLPTDRQRLLLEASPAYRDPLLCRRLCRQTEAAAADDPAEALRLAEAALLVARYLPEPLGSRARGWCMGFIGNIQRVIGSDFTAADGSFAQARRLWQAGKDPEGLFSEANLLDMEASLRRAQRQFQRAMGLHAEALALARPEEKGSILLNMAGTSQQQGHHEESLRVLTRATDAIDGERQPRLRYGALFNRASNLLLLSRSEEAALLVPEVRLLADRLCNAIDGIRTTWLEANCETALGRRRAALAKLEEVRQAFADIPMPFDYALASLDAVLIYREEGCLPEIKALAAEMLAIFRAQKVHREAIAAVILFQEAAEKERVTQETVQGLKDLLGKAKGDLRSQKML